MRLKILFIGIIFLISAALTFAQSQGLAPDCGSGAFGTKACQWEDFISTVQNLLQFVTTTLAFTVASLIVLIGAFMYMLGGPNQNNATKGKNMMIGALLGYAGVVMAGILFDLALEFVGPKLYPTNSPTSFILRYFLI